MAQNLGLEVVRKGAVPSRPTKRGRGVEPVQCFRHQTPSPKTTGVNKKKKFSAKQTKKKISEVNEKNIFSKKRKKANETKLKKKTIFQRGKYAVKGGGGREFGEGRRE